MERQLIIHFGAGSLGRGFIVPILTDSNCDVIVVDVNEKLINKLKQTLEYTIYIADEEEGKRERKIKIKGALSSINDIDELKRVLKEVKTVTTSVRKENLVHVAKLISEVWRFDDNETRKVLCCENLENASDYFKKLLFSTVSDDKTLEQMKKIVVPDTMVDRGCSASLEDDLLVYTEKFFEIGVDREVLKDTNIKLIPSVDNLKQCFYRKRFLLNTYADSVAFLGLKYNISTLREAICDNRVQKELRPYFDLVKKSLEVGFGMNTEEIEKWNNFYRNERNKSKDPNVTSNKRALSDIARDMWRKLEREERFIKPLLILKDNNYNIDPGLNLIRDMVESEAKKSNMSKHELINKIKDMWAIDASGEYIFNYISELV
jgi:mannitol-1-phosphate 5-dehydrogenase